MSPFLTIILGLLWLMPDGAIGTARGPAGALVAPVVEQQFSTLTSYDRLQQFVMDVSAHTGWRVDTIARTVQGRAVVALYVTASPPFGSDPSKLRVLCFAQQHGDEPSGKEALTLLLAELASGTGKRLLDSLDLLVVPQMNPDGAELRQRRSADSVDLNRSHLLLITPQVEGLHALFNRWVPAVTLDIHEYSSYSKEWQDAGFVKRGDVQIGTLTNLNIPAALRTYEREEVLPAVRATVEADGYTCHEYIVGSPADRVRHSTTETNDGRQSFGILGTLSFIQEGRKWRSLEDQLERRARSQLAGVKGLLQYCARNASSVRRAVAETRAAIEQSEGTLFVTEMEHRPGTAQLKIPVERVSDRAPLLWNVHPYHGVVVSVGPEVQLPHAYLVPAGMHALINLLERQGVEMRRVDVTQRMSAEVYRIDSVKTLTLEEEEHTLPVCTRVASTVTVHPGDVLVPLRQVRALLIATLLEPQSMWGTSKSPRLLEGAERRGEYPVYRLEN